MSPNNILALLAFTLFVLATGAAAFACWHIFITSEERTRNPDISEWQRAHAWFGVVTMILPALAFTFGFMAFLYILIEHVVSLVAKLL
ncbi:MAG: hypothetical protein FD146_2075 [Anaerolineaceae bacterium]|nr:MAG: hypothetical protein FD146_2075 [Anaerolineaceae bacterium]